MYKILNIVKNVTTISYKHCPSSWKWPILVILGGKTFLGSKSSAWQFLEAAPKFQIFLSKTNSLQRLRQFPMQMLSQMLSIHTACQVIHHKYSQTRSCPKLWAAAESSWQRSGSGEVLLTCGRGWPDWPDTPGQHNVANIIWGEIKLH